MPHSLARSLLGGVFLILFAGFIALLVTHPQWMLVALAYGYLLSAFIGLAWTKLRRRPSVDPTTG